MALCPERRITFVSLCKVFESIAGASQKQEKLRPLEQLWLNLRASCLSESSSAAVAKAEHAASANDPLPAPASRSSSIGETFFAFMRLCMPQLDAQRATYGLKESKIAKLYVELLGLPPSSGDAIRFLNWKDPSKNSIETTCFSDVVFVVLGKRGYGQQLTTGCEPLTVLDVNEELNELCNAPTPSGKKLVLMRLLQRCCALEHKWLIRVLTKEMRMHLMHQSILAAFHPSALELYNNTSDLMYVCRKCTEPSEMLVAGDMRHGIFLFQPFRPMLASVVSNAKLTALLDSEEKLIVEPKFDGERMMIHISHDKIAYWTRNAKNYTSLYGPKFDHVVRQCTADRGISNVIFDGEFLLYDDDAKEYKEFGSNRTFALRRDELGGGDDAAVFSSPPLHAAVAAKHHSGDGALTDPHPPTDGPEVVSEESKNLWFCFQAFDVLFLNGCSLLTEPLEKRKAMLRNLIRVQPTRMEVTPFTHVSSVVEIVKQLDVALTDKHEGVMIKVATSHYVPGERRTKWMKLKPDHVSGLADTLDMIILGGYYGTKYGMRDVSHFLLGVWNNDSSADPVTSDAKFLTVCKVGSGYSDQELRALRSQLDDKWIPLPHGTVPEWLGGWKPAAGEVPDVYINPTESVVLEIFGYSFQSTTKFSFGQTLRFPRCHRVRLDKTVVEATDLVQLRQIVDVSKSHFRDKLAAISSSEGLVMVQAAKKAAKKKEEETRADAEKRLIASRTIAVVSPTIQVPLPQSVPRVTQFLRGYEVCVLFASPELPYPKGEVEKLVLAHGGTVVAHPQHRTSLILASGGGNAKVMNWIAQCRKDPTAMAAKYCTTSLLRISWFLDCVAVATVLPLAPRHVIYASPELERLFRQTLDRYNDSFYDDATVEQLKESIELVRTSTQPHHSNNIDDGLHSATARSDASTAAVITPTSELSTLTHTARRNAFVRLNAALLRLRQYEATVASELRTSPSAEVQGPVSAAVERLMRSTHLPTFAFVGRCPEEIERSQKIKSDDVVANTGVNRQRGQQVSEAFSTPVTFVAARRGLKRIREELLSDTEPQRLATRRRVEDGVLADSDDEAHSELQPRDEANRSREWTTAQLSVGTSVVASGEGLFDPDVLRASFWVDPQGHMGLFASEKSSA